MKKNRSIQNLALHSISLSGVLSIAFLAIFLFFWGQKILTSHLTEASTANSQAMLVGLEALMKRGANSKELQGLVNDMNSNFSNMEISLVTEQFPKLDNIEVLRSEDSMVVQYPVVLKAQCVSCHSDEKVGQQKATIIHQYPITEVVFSLTDVFVLLITFTLVSFLLMFVLTFLYLKFWVIQPLKDLSHFIDQINSHDELDFIDKTSNISEVENIRDAFNKLGRALSHSYIQSVYAAETDELTGIGNRRQMQEVLNLEIQKAAQTDSIFSIFLLDLNGFKAINDKLGHNVGDMALVHFTNVMKQVLRHEDFIFRLGGDEFILLLKNVHQDNAGAVKTRIHSLLEQAPLKLDNDKTLYIKTSVGSACYPEDSIELDQLIEQADKDMFKNKEKFYMRSMGKGKD